MLCGKLKFFKRSYVSNCPKLLSFDKKTDNFYMYRGGKNLIIVFVKAKKEENFVKRD